MGILEHAVKILLTARVLGRVNAFGADDVRVQDAARQRIRTTRSRDGEYGEAG